MTEKKGILVISFGTSYRETCEKTIGAIEKDLQKAFPERILMRAWTSRFIRKKVLERDGEKILSPEEALAQLKGSGVRDLLIQPTHMLDGAEYAKILDALQPELEQFADLSIGRPLLETEGDIREFADIIAGIFSGVKETEMAAFMGHGSDSIRLPVYDLLNEAFAARGRGNLCVGTVESEPGIGPVLAGIRERRPEKVFLSPLLVVAGDHARKDMAGDSPDSWESRIRAEGIETECILKGLGEYPEVRAMYVRRAKEAAQAGSSV